MKRIFSKLLGGALLFGLTMSLTSCEDVLGHWEKPSPNPITPGTVTPTVEEVIKYGFKVTDLAGVDRTEAVTSLKMSNEDGTLVAEAEVSGGKITITNTKLTEAGITAAADFWFEAEIGGKPYVAKVNINPTALSPETPMTLAMATLGDVILADGTFAASSSTETKVAMIAYLGSETAEATNKFNHGLALAMSDCSDIYIDWNNSNSDAGHNKQTSSTFTEESGLQYNDTHNTDTYPAFKLAKANKSTVAPTGCSAWFLASGYQWNQMLGANGYGLAKLTETANGYTGLNSGRYYWSSTEKDNSYAWRFYANDGSWGEAKKENGVDPNGLVRSCLAF